MGIPKDSTLSAAMMKAKRRRHRQPLFNTVESELQKQKQSRIETENDIALWKGKKYCFHSKFLSKETWAQIRNTLPEMQGYKEIWFSNSTPKYAFLTWLIQEQDSNSGENGKMETKCRH